jgi:hypothetical protein
MKPLYALAALAFSALPAKAAICYVEVNALVVIDGPCDFVPFGGDGSFQVFSPDRSYFAQVSINRPGEADGWWNQDRWSSHAHASLGQLRRNDACWQNAYATVCAW